MKIKPDHFVKIKAKIESFLSFYGKEKIIQQYETGDFLHSDKVKDLQTRFNFDLYYLSGALKELSSEIYQYANDDHVATALKRICPNVERKY